MKNIVLIPSYKPDKRLSQLVNSLNNVKDLMIMVVNNGNGQEFNNNFNKIEKLDNIFICNIKTNKGKGYGIKKGIEEILRNHSFVKNIIFADGDGQHTIDDIIKFHKELNNLNMKKTFLIGNRRHNFNTPKINLFGNTMYKFFFSLIRGININDSLCGLRAIALTHSKNLLKMHNNDFAFEVECIIKLVKMNFNIKEIDISSTYFSDNKSNFQKFSDSLRLVKLLFKKY